jgi:hypothetical protein
MEFVFLIVIALVLGAIGTIAFKLYIKRNFPGVYQMMYQPEEFDKLMQAIKTSSEV